MKREKLCGGRLDHVEVDHTKLEMSVVVHKLDRPICRPWLTVVMCADSKIIVGFHLGSSEVEPSDCWLAMTNRKEKV